MGQARDFLTSEINRMKGKNLVISTDVPLKNNGDLYASWPSKRGMDPGVAVYFDYKDKKIVMCCDRYESIWENIYALGKGIEAIRGMERWGVSEFIERAFTGFTALPDMALDEFACYEVLGIEPTKNPILIERAYKTRAKTRHPDTLSGSTEQFQELTKAYEQALAFCVK